MSPDGLKSGQYQGFSNTGGEDEAMTRAIMADMEAKYCVDKARYFSTGFSFGGSMSYTAACNMSDVFRAIGAMSGAPISGAKCTSQKPARPVAVWATHGDMDTALQITLAEPIIEALAEYNGCTTETKAVDPSPCVEYRGCTSGYPVVWCPRPGDPRDPRLRRGFDRQVFPTVLIEELADSNSRILDAGADSGGHRVGHS